jgi:hypothetical protein
MHTCDIRVAIRATKLTSAHLAHPGAHPARASSGRRGLTRQNRKGNRYQVLPPPPLQKMASYTETPSREQLEEVTAKLAERDKTTANACQEYHRDGALKWTMPSSTSSEDTTTPYLCSLCSLVRPGNRNHNFCRLKEASEESLSTHELVNLQGASFSFSYPRILSKTLSL